ncbi:MAG: Hsp20/alpha crystallin family protein [Hyphomicrobiaceae bacterium]
MVQRTQASNWWPSVYEPLRRAGKQVADWFAPKSDAAASADNYRIAMELPGVESDDIEIYLDGDALVVKGEKRVEHEEKTDSYFFSEREYGAFQRTFHIPPDADGDQVSADFKNGVLKITVLKAGPKASRARKISIST